MAYQPFSVQRRSSPIAVRPATPREPASASRHLRPDRPVRAAPSAHDVISGGGQPLDAETRARLEPHFGRDFSRVRVHADDRAAASAKSLDAEAYTVGSDIVFARGAYQPASACGQRLISHELTHALQQGMARQARPDLGLAPTDDPAEREARDQGELAPMSAAGRQSADGHAGPAGAPGTGAAFLRRRPVAIARQLDRHAPPTLSQAHPTPPSHGQPKGWSSNYRRAIHSEKVVSDILRQEFPVAGTNWSSGFRGDLKASGEVRADIAGGRGGQVMWNVSSDFADGNAKADEDAKNPAKIGIVRREVMRVLE